MRNPHGGINHKISLVWPKITARVTVYANVRGLDSLESLSSALPLGHDFSRLGVWSTLPRRGTSAWLTCNWQNSKKDSSIEFSLEVVVISVMVLVYRLREQRVNRILYPSLWRRVWLLKSFY